MYTRWAPLLVINVVTTPINGVKKLVSLGLFHPYKWSYFTLLRSGFLDPLVGEFSRKTFPTSVGRMMLDPVQGVQTSGRLQLSG